MTNRESTIACNDVSMGALLLPYKFQTITRDECRSFEEHLLVCPACQRELNVAGSKLNEIAASRQEIARLARQESEPTRSQVTKTEVSIDQRPFRHFLGYLAAASAIVAIMIGTLWESPKLTETAAQPDSVATSTEPVRTSASSAGDSIPDSAERLAKLATRAKLPFLGIITRGTDDPNDAKFSRAMQAYTADSLRTAQTLLAEISRTAPNNVDVWLFLGVTAYLNGDYVAANASLQRGLALNTRATERQQIRWYLASLALQQGDSSSALRYLDQIITENMALVKDAQSLATEIRKGEP